MNLVAAYIECPYGYGKRVKKFDYAFILIELGFLIAYLPSGLILPFSANLVPISRPDLMPRVYFFVTKSRRLRTKEDSLPYLSLFNALEFIARGTSRIPDKDQVKVRYYGPNGSSRFLKTITIRRQVVSGQAKGAGG